jgi:hypothetical protein
VQVDLSDVSASPPVTQIQYWLTRDPPQTAAVPTPATSPSTASSAGTTSAAADPAPAPAPAPTDVAKKTKETVDKLRGLFGH